MSTLIRPATAADRSGVVGLLREAGLPDAGVPADLRDFVVAERDGALGGAAGLEVYDDTALLRSVVVAPAWRGTGLGKELVDYVLASARARGIGDIYLLTTTAEHWFPRFGFRPVARATVPAPLHASAEFQGACPESAVVMCCAAAGKS